MSAVALIREAARSGVWVGLDGDRLALRARARPPDDLLDKLRRNKPEIVALLRQDPPGWIFRCRMAGGRRRRPAA